MASSVLDQGELSRMLDQIPHNLNNPLAVPKFQHTCEICMDFVRRDALRGDVGHRLMDKFCDLVNNSVSWRVAQMVVPEFRSAQQTLPEV